MNYRKLIPLILLTLIALFSYSSYIFSEESDFEFSFFNATHYLAIIILAFCWYSFFELKDYFKYIFYTTLFLGLINVANFTIDTYTLMFQFGSLKLMFQPFIFCLMILTYYLNYQKINNLISQEIIGNDYFEKVNMEKISKFESNFEAKSNEELMNITIDAKYSNEAKQAAQNLINKRTI